MTDNKLNEVRTRRGMSITELSRRSNISRHTLHKLENGTSNNPTVATVDAICRALEKKPDEIFFGNAYVCH